MPGQEASEPDGWRTPEAEVLGGFWAGARAGRPLTVVLSGDSGAGKTRLVQGLAERAEGDGAVVVCGAAVDVGEQPPCWPVTVGVRRLLAAAQDAPGRVALQPWCAELSALLEPATGAAPSMPSGYLLELVRRVVSEVAVTTPVLLVVEDLHWADRTTRELIVSLVAHLDVERVLVVVTVRSEAISDGHPLRRLLPELARDRHVRTLDLAPLERATVAEVVGRTASAGSRPPDPGMVDLVWRRSGGNAFIVAETLRAISDGDPDGVSPTLRGLVLARVAGLGAAARAIIRALAVGEEPVPHALLGAVVGAAEADLVPALREAADASVIVVDTAVEGYGLRHGLMRDVIAAELMPGERRDLHRRWALALDDALRASEVTDPDLALQRAHHWLRADDPDRALPAVVHAAHVAEQMREYGTAHRQWMAALDLSAQPTPTARNALTRPPPPRALAAGAGPEAWSGSLGLLTRAADTATLAGEYDAAVGLLRRMVPDLSVAGPEELPTVVRLGRSLLDAGRTGDAVAVLRSAQAGVSARTDPGADAPPELAALHAAHADALLITGDVRGAQQEAERALDVSRRTGERPEQSRMLATLGFALAYLENPDAGLAAVAEGLRIAERTDEPGGVGRAYRAWADLLSGPLGELGEGVEIARQGVARMRDLGLARTWGVRLLATAANGLFRQGRWREAQDAVDEAWSLRPTGADELEVRLARCRLRTGRGELDGAEDDLRAVDLLALDGGGEQFPGIGSDVSVSSGPAVVQRSTVASRYRVPLMTLRSGVAMWRGHPEQARVLVGRGLDVAEHTPDDVFLVAPLVWHGLRAEAEAVAHGGRADPAALARLATHVEHLEQRVPHTVPALRRTVVAYVQMCRAETGRAAGASDPMAWGRVAQTWNALLNPYPAAYALLRRAEALLDSGSRTGEAARTLRAAADTARAMGASPFLEEIADLARRARLDLEHAGDPVVTGTGATPGLSGRTGRSTSELAAPELAGLTGREYEVLGVMAEGLSNRDIAKRLYISERTVAVHVSRVLTKTGTRSRTQAAALLQRVRARPPAP